MVPTPGRFILLVIVGFVGWGAVLSLTVAPYSSAVAVVVQWFLDWTTPHDLSPKVTSSFPRFIWTVVLKDGASAQDSVGTWLVCYNGALYLSLLTVSTARRPVRALLFAASGLPLLFLFHVGDVALAVESRLQTRLFPEFYSFWLSFNFRFATVKFLHHFSMLAVKQVLPILLLVTQYGVVSRLEGEATALKERRP